MRDDILTEAHMEALAKAAKHQDVYWQNPTSGALKRVCKVYPEPFDVEGDGFEIPVAYLENGYIDLENTFQGSFMVMQPLFGEENDNA